MPNILTDTVATFSSDDVFNPAKVNSTPRLPTEAWEYPIAQWANEVDGGLKDVNSWLQGDSPAGKAGKNVRLVGGVWITENAGFAGGDPSDLLLANGIAIGSTSDSEAALQIQTDSSGLAALYFTDFNVINGITYSYSSDTMKFLVDGLEIIEAQTAGLFPSSNVTYALGDDSLRWASLASAAINVSASATFGSGAAAIDVDINGGTIGGQEPRLVLKQAGSEIGSIRATSAGDVELTVNAGNFKVSSSGALQLPRLTTAERNALPNTFGFVVYDTTANLTYWNNGSSWLQFQSGNGGASEVVLTAANAIIPVVDGATQFTTAAGQEALMFPNAATSSVDWFIKIPSTYTGGKATLRMLWTGLAASANNVEWQFRFETLAAGVNVGVGGGLISAGLFLKSGPGSANVLIESLDEIETSDMDSPSAGDIMRVQVTRNGNAVNDTYASSAYILSVEILT